MAYIPGDHWVVCDVCGFEYRQSQIRVRWDGLAVCPEDYEARHPQDFVKARKEDISAKGIVRPEPDPVYIDHRYLGFIHPDNLILYPNTFAAADSDWVENPSAVVTSNTELAIDGVEYADLLTDDTGSSKSVSYAITSVDVTKYFTVSLIIKKDAVGKSTRFPELALYFDTGDTLDYSALWIDTSTGEKFVSPSHLSIQDYGVIDCGDWWRIWLNVKPTYLNNTRALVYIYPAAGSGTLGVTHPDAQGTITACWAELVQSDTPHIPTYYIPPTVPASTF